MSDIPTDFNTFFHNATGFEPYPYQKQLATSSIPSVINVATGSGKTEAAILCVWLWRRLQDDSETPRRLIYCLPRRVLVEQTVDRVKKWLRNLGLADRIRLSTMIGDNVDRDLTLYPTHECIIIGTQDMLVSGALNRAYGTSPYRWPQVFGLLNNDSLWVLDEVQIMENTLPTSRQMDAFRKRFGTCGPQHTIWMSATTNTEWLKTVDSPSEPTSVCRLSETGDFGALKKSMMAPKTLHKADITMQGTYGPKDVQYLQDLHQHGNGTTTAIIVNTVKRAQNLYDTLIKKGVRCTLIHSRFREADRRKLNGILSNMGEQDDKIIVSTQVLESGVDISVGTMISELAPQSSMIQRFGRCNRKGNLDCANIYWIDIPSDKKYAPYDIDEMDSARKMLESLSGKSVSPGNLRFHDEPKVFDSILRKKDIMDLFDTVPDLSGNYVDASRFVRNTRRQLDVNVFWRDKDSTHKPHREEICAVPISELRNFLKDRKIFGKAWNYRDGLWEIVSQNTIFPGQTVMLDRTMGGYTDVRGWSADSDVLVETVSGATEEQNDSYDADSQSKSKYALTLEAHTCHVLCEIRKILGELKFLDKDIRDVIIDAVKYHDIGKTHAVFQETMRKGMGYGGDTVWAKSTKMGRHRIPGFRHEAASALAYLEHTNQFYTSEGDLAAYLIASHHGKVRLSMRNINRKDTDNQYLMGLIVDGDKLPEFSSDVVSIDKTAIDLSVARMGRVRDNVPSWTERTLALLNRYGPFRLAYMEMLVVAADRLASKNEQDGVYDA